MASPAGACGGIIDSPTDGGGGDAPPGCVVTGPAAHGGCGWQVQVNDPKACGLVADGSPQPPDTCVSICGDATAQFCYAYASTDPQGQTTYSVSCGQGCMGRLPESVRLAPRRAGRTKGKERTERAVVGEHLARAAYLEAASVDAFYILYDELAAHGAPRRLLSAALRAARDEVRHAREAGALAKRYGARPAKPRVRRRPPRDLATVAVENAIEGCVRETFGALVAMWQAERASDRAVRETMGRIARDEVRHAELGWRVSAWAEAKLDAAGRERVRAAREAAVRELLASARERLPEAVVATLGMPAPAEAAALARTLDAALWRQAA
ncbi:MAG TPA: ferritin-like domain-containing protein [Polyangiaceae bacterium]|nr:ferritin-like domain-containing protein [Polyangiaceae bacterium]